MRVGDVVRMESDDFIPADLILITSSTLSEHRSENCVQPAAVPDEPAVVTH